MTQVRLIESNDTGNETIAACSKKEGKISWECNHSILYLNKCQTQNQLLIKYQVEQTSKINLSIPSELSLIPDFQQQNVISKAKKLNLIAFSL